MFSKIFKQLFRNKFTTAITFLVVVLGGYFGYQAIIDGDEAVHYSVAAVEKGTLIVSVSGSGQVTVLDQVDIKPKVSGEITDIYIKKDQEVWIGQLAVVLDSEGAQRAIRDAELTLENAQRDLDEAKENYQDIDIDAKRSLEEAYEDGYSTVSTVFFKLSDYMQDLKNVLGTEEDAQKYITGYELILGRDSIFTQTLLDDYDRANDLFNKNFDFFREVYKEDDRDTIYQLISDTLETTRVISRTLESARHMYDAIMLKSYEYLHISSQINEMQPKIENDVSAVYSNINSLRQIKDNIDDTNENTPKEIEDAQLAIQSFENIVVQREEALLDAKDNLADHYIYIPFSGVIAEVGNVKKGDSVSSNTVLATLITKQKVAQISLNEIDATNIEVNQKATLTFDALPEVSIMGKVSEVDVVGQVSQGVVSYGMKIAFDTDIEQVKPGMSVTVDIITEAKTDVLVLPSGAIKFKGDMRYVELVEADGEYRQQLLANISGTILPISPKLQTVETGLSNDLSTEIISGLKEGDIVVVSSVNKTQMTVQDGGFQMMRMRSFGK